MIGPNELTAAQASLVAAIVGAVSALAVVLVRDLVIERNKGVSPTKASVGRTKAYGNLLAALDCIRGR